MREGRGHRSGQEGVSGGKEDVHHTFNNTDAFKIITITKHPVTSNLKKKEPWAPHTPVPQHSDQEQHPPASKLDYKYEMTSSPITSLGLSVTRGFPCWEFSSLVPRPRASVLVFHFHSPTSPPSARIQRLSGGPSGLRPARGSGISTKHHRHSAGSCPRTGAENDGQWENWLTFRLRPNTCRY